MLSPKIFTNLHIIMYILILDFQLVGGVREMFTYIFDKSRKALSVLLGGCGREKIAFVLVVVPVVFSNGYSRPTIHYFFSHNVYCALEAQL